LERGEAFAGNAVQGFQVLSLSNAVSLLLGLPQLDWFLPEFKVKNPLCFEFLVNPVYPMVSGKGTHSMHSSKPLVDILVPQPSYFLPLTSLSGKFQVKALMSTACWSERLGTSGTLCAMSGVEM